MGFYQQKQEMSQTVNKKSPRAWHWIAIVAVSAIVGSGTTLAMLPVLQNSGYLSAMSPVAANGYSGVNVSPVSTSVNVNVSDGITQAVKVAEPAVMGVVNYAQNTNFFTQQTTVQPSGVGTGVLFYKDNRYGYLVTNNHVVQGAVKVDVVLSTGGKHVAAIVVGTDPYTDLAVLKVPTQSVRNINPVTFANSDNLQAGEPAIAIGTPMGLDFADSVTAGIVSATKRIMPVEDPNTQQTLDYQAVIQTDAAINPGNSGGPLLNINGQVIGINSSKIVAQNFEGMGFAIPANEVQQIANQIMKTGHAVHPSLGIEGYSLSTLPQQWWPNVPVDYGVWVKGITTANAKASGLQAQDVIVGFNGHQINTMADLRTYLFQTSPGQSAKLRVYRGSQLLNLNITIGSMDTQLTTSSAQSQPQSEGNGADPLDPFTGGSGF